MDLLLSCLKQMPEYRTLVECVNAGQAAAVTGAAQMGRSHILASLYAETGRPMVALCQDELAAKRLQSDWKN